jgi:hypothetical protein
VGEPLMTLEPAPMVAAASTRPGRDWGGNSRIAGLRRFALAISVLTLLGHAWLGFEQAFIHPLAALATGYSLELLLELVDAWALRRPPAWRRGSLVDFLLSPHITSLAIAMLLYPGDRVGPVVFATGIAITSKYVLRARVSGRSRHIFNPSNLGITVCLLAFPWVGIAPPYMFTKALGPVGDWALPGLIVVSGSLLNALFTRRLPLIGAWLTGFLAQAILRHELLGVPLTAALMPMSGMAFLLFTFYMVTDPATTPTRPRDQVAFGLATAATYGALITAHVVFGLFFSLSLVCAGRAAWAWLQTGARQTTGPQAASSPVPR